MNIEFSWRRRVPVVLQSEAAECGLACLVMVAGYHQLRTDLPSLRALYSISLKGTTLADLARCAAKLDLVPRAVRLELPQLAQLRLPCVLHWDFNHFVVLERVRARTVTIVDPARGRRELAMDELSKHFTGIAQELVPAHDFRPGTRQHRISLGRLIGPLPGAAAALARVLLLALALQVFTVLAPFHLQWVVDQALVSQDRELVIVLAIGFALLAVVHTCINALRGWLLVVIGTTLNLQLQSNLFRHLLRLPLSWFDRRHTGDVVSRFDALQTIQRTLTGGLVESLVDGVMVLITLAMMLLYSVQLTLVAMLAAGLYALLRLALYRPLREATEEQIVRAARQQTHFIETVRGMQCLKLFGQEDQRLSQWKNLAIERFNAGIRVQRFGVLHQALNGLLFGIENIVTVSLASGAVLDRSTHFSVGMLLAFVAYKTQFVQRISGLVEKGLELRMMGLHTERVADVAMCPQEAVHEAGASAAAPAHWSITLTNVSFRYAEADALVIDDLSLRIEEGESVAFVGPSGCGKTTLVRLMLGLLTPTSGSVEIGGVPLQRLGLARYRGAVASVMQDDQLFAGSIADNICFFDSRSDQQLIEASARAAAVFDDIAAMPMQFNTLVGDMGTVLSGGQRQRILLARALYRKPRILILDEATSHLDIQRERAVNEAVKALRLTRIIVAHRQETIASAERVIVLSKGRMVNSLTVVEGAA